MAALLNEMNPECTNFRACSSSLLLYSLKKNKFKIMHFVIQKRK